MMLPKKRNLEIIFALTGTHHVAVSLEVHFTSCLIWLDDGRV